MGTNCPIPPNTNYTYRFQAKDQIGTYTYFPSTELHKASGGFGALNLYHRSVIPIPYPNPDGDFTLLIGDWYRTNHKVNKMRFLLLLINFNVNFPWYTLIGKETLNTSSCGQPADVGSQ